MKGERVEVKGNRMYPLKTILDSSIRGAQTDIGALAVKGKKQVTAMVWNYADKDKLGETELVTVNLNGFDKMAKKVKLIQYRIDEHHSSQSLLLWSSLKFRTILEMR